MISIQDFEDQVWEVEGIRLIIRGGTGDKVEEYNYQNAAQNNWSVTKWLQSRVLPCTNGLEVIVVQGNGEEPHGRTLLRNVKSSYHTQL